MANDPSSLVESRLLHHLHLLSTHRFPHQSQAVQYATIRDFLLQAPHIVKDRATVSWSLMSKPQNGQIFLAWQPPRMQLQFATDGYLWPFQEKSYQQNLEGFQIELIVAEGGYDPHLGRRAMHRRTRYRLLSNSQNQPFDPNLEIVQYTAMPPLNQGQIYNNVQVHPSVFNSLQQSRDWVERLGIPQRNEFMLHDSTRWPRIEAPRQQMPMNPYQGNAPFGRAAPRGALGPGGQQLMGRNQAKGMGMGMPPGPAAINGNGARRAGSIHESSPHSRGHYTAVEDESQLLDSIDLLNPHDISITRFKQHHEWMEEILSSPFHESQLKPVELGLRLTGELGYLTSGLFDSSSLSSQPSSIANAPSRDASLVDMYAQEADNGGRTPGGADTSVLHHFEIADFERFDEAKLKELDKRVTEYLKQGEKQISSMKQAHSRRMDELKREKLFAHLERLVGDISTGDSDHETRIEALRREAEEIANATVIAHEKITCVQKGGLMSETEQAEAGIEDEQEEELETGVEIQQEGISAEGSNADARQFPNNGDINNTNMINAGDNGNAFDNYTNMDTPAEPLQFLDHEDDMDYNN